MSPAQFAMHDFILVPLTPIHIGGGVEAELLPESYRIRDSMMEFISARAAFRCLPADQQNIWIKDLARDGRATVERLLAEAPDDLVAGRIPISRPSEDALQEKSRKGQVDAFIRSGGQPFIPGSSLKGALRTAWMATMVRKKSLANITDYKRLNQSAFDLADGSNATDTDPMRDVTVQDAPVPETSGLPATRIDQVATWKRKDGQYDFDTVGQIHRERLRAVVDGGAPPLTGICMGLRTVAVRKERQGFDEHHYKTPQRAPQSVAAFLEALEAHHAPLWRREVDEKFFANKPGARLRQALALFGHLSRGGHDPDAALIRLGWAAHAESKSIADLRKICRPQAKGAGKIAAEGSTRHVINLQGQPAPFGWALLVHQERWKAPQDWLSRVMAASAPVGHHGAGRTTTRPQTVLGSQIKYRKGQRVKLNEGEEAVLLEDVTAATVEVNAKIGGDSEPINVSEIKGLA